MYKYTILYKNGKTWSGKANYFSEITPVDCVVMVCSIDTGAGYKEQSFWVPTGGGLDNEWYWYLLNELYVPVSKQRKPNPKSKTKKQKRFDQDYREWANIWMSICGTAGGVPSVKAYKKQLWNMKQLITDVRKDIRGHYDQWLKDKGYKLQEDEGWIPWHGGPCPIEANTNVVVKFKCGDTCSAFYAGDWNWGWEEPEHGYNIVAYKLLQTESKPIKTTYTFWLGAGGEVE